MKVEAITKYLYKGVEYKSLKDIKEKIHDIIGFEVLDKINRVCPPAKHKDFIKLLDVLCSKEVREVLKECYSVEFEQEVYSDDWVGIGQETETINILDIE